MSAELEFAVDTVQQVGALLVCEAGARSTDRRGAESSFASPVPRIHGIAAANKQIHSAALSWLISNDVQKS